MPDYTFKTPTLNVHKGSLRGPLEANADDEVILSFTTLGLSPELYPVILLQCDPAATVEVLGLDGATWLPYPGTLTSGALKIIRGRWTALKVLTTEDVWFKGDLDWQAWLVTP
jgi:hypothetical protein